MPSYLLWLFPLIGGFLLTIFAFRVGFSYGARSVLAGPNVNFEQVVAERRRADRFFDHIQSALDERDGWRDLYLQQAGGHDNAQALMMSQLDLFVRQHGMKLPPIIERVRQDFVSQHGPDARAAHAAKEQVGPLPPGERTEGEAK